MPRNSVDKSRRAGSPAPIHPLGSHPSGSRLPRPRPASRPGRKWIVYAFVDQPVERLPNAGRFVLWAMRAWGEATAAHLCPPGALASGFAGVGACNALHDFHATLYMLQQGASPPLAMANMGNATIREDEAVLLALWGDLAAGRRTRVAATLAIIVGAAAPEILQTMTRATEALSAAGFDLSQSSLKENK